MNLREYLMLVGAVCALMGVAVVLLGMRQLRAVQPSRRLGVSVPGLVMRFQPKSAVAGTVPGQAGCAGAVIIFVGSMFLLGGLVFLAAGLLVP